MNYEPPTPRQLMAEIERLESQLMRLRERCDQATWHQWILYACLIALSVSCAIHFG